MEEILHQPCTEQESNTLFQSPPRPRLCRLGPEQPLKILSFYALSSTSSSSRTIAVGIDLTILRAWSLEREVKGEQNQNLLNWSDKSNTYLPLHIKLLLCSHICPTTLKSQKNVSLSRIISLCVRLVSIS